MTNAVWDWSSTPASNNATPPYGWPAGMNGSQVEPTGRQMMATISEAIHSLVAGGTADVITGTLANVPTALTDGMQVLVRAGAANATTTPTFNLNSLGAFTITKLGGTALIAGDIAGALHELILRYNSAHTRWELLNPASVPAVISIADATNGGLNFSASTGAVTAKINPSDLLTKATPAVSDSIVIMDAAASNAPKTATVAKVVSALFTPTTATMTGNVALNVAAQNFDGPGISGAGSTWLAIGKITLTLTGASGDDFAVQLWDGTTIVDSTIINIQPNEHFPVTLCGIFTSPAGNMRMTARSAATTTGVMVWNASGGSHDSQITIIRLA